MGKDKSANPMDKYRKMQKKKVNQKIFMTLILFVGNQQKQTKDQVGKRTNE